MSFDYSKLCGRIREKFGTQAEFSRVMNMSERTLSLKLSGKRAWTQPDIGKAIKCLDLSESDIPVYFFKRKVQNIEQNCKEAAAG
ncbi:DUF739 family protein [Lachnospiraceae bacterium 50-23]